MPNSMISKPAMATTGINDYNHVTFAAINDPSGYQRDTPGIACS
jgi:hypothetical protein